MFNEKKTSSSSNNNKRRLFNHNKQSVSYSFLVLSVVFACLRFGGTAFVASFSFASPKTNFALSRSSSLSSSLCKYFPKSYSRVGSTISSWPFSLSWHPSWPSRGAGFQCLQAMVGHPNQPDPSPPDSLPFENSTNQPFHQQPAHYLPNPPLETSRNNYHHRRHQDDNYVKQVLEALDVPSVLELVARHAGTKRGKDSILAVARDFLLSNEHKRSTNNFNFLSKYTKTKENSRKQWAQQERTQHDSGFFRELGFQLKLAQSAEEARREYELIEQACLLLREDSGPEYQLTIPPFYGADSGPFDTRDNFADTDDDEWLDLPVSDWTLEDILKAEQIVKLLLRVYIWSKQDASRSWTPLLSEIGARINIENLTALSDEISNTVEVKRTRTVLDPSGRSSFVFRLNSDKYPTLRLFREKEVELQKRSLGQQDTNKKLAELQEEMMHVQQMIQDGLTRTIARYRRDIDHGLSIVARLDALLARAAFGAVHGAAVPTIKSNGVIHVQGFRHPLLQEDSNRGRVPVDLCLSGSQNERALIISGPNGGGKTLAMKSFGLVAVFVKLGIPLPCNDSIPPRVDFFDVIHASIGDQQDVLKGQSTFMAQLSSYASLVRQVDDSESLSTLVLLDEIGSGTDQNAGGAIAQAILEKLLMSSAGVRIVATSHCPRLKTLSFEDPNFGCASVLLDSANENSNTKKPTYELHYGVIGDSYALGAASRCVPHLPEDVIERATSLLGDQYQEAAYLRTLEASMRKQLELAQIMRREGDEYRSNAAVCQAALKRLALAYERHFGLLDQRLEKCYQEIKKNPNGVELLGNVLSEVRTARKQAKTRVESLQEQGLRLVPDNYSFTDGESVTIIAEGEWNGEMATVCLSAPEGSARRLGPDDVVVSPSLLPWQNPHSGGGDSTMASPLVLIFKKSQLAIWDYESAFEGASDNEGPSTSVWDTKRKLNSLLAKLGNTNNSVTRSGSSSSRGQDSSPSKSFTSSRERKASRKKGKGR